MSETEEVTPGLSDKQKWSVRRATKRLNIWHGAVRSGKTVGSIYKFLQFIGDSPKGDLLLAGKTIDALKRNVINPLLDLVGSEGQYFPGKRILKLWNKDIYTVGASDERSEGKIRGSTIAGAYGDELTLWPESFFRMMLSRMSVEGAQFFGSTNPDNPNHWLKKGFMDRKGELDLSLFHFSLEDNPYLPKEYIDALKLEYTGLWYKRFILGLWCVAEGAIYDFFDENIHVLPRNRLPEATSYSVGYDYGTTNPTAFLLFGENPLTTPKIWAEKEFFWNPAKEKRQKTDGEFAKDFVKFIAPYKHKITGIYGDPSAESFKLQLQRDGVTRLKDTNNDVLDGIRTVGSMLFYGQYAICEDCKNYVDEFFSYSWDEKAQVKGEDKPIKRFDHLQDAGRYPLHTKFGSKNYDISKFAA